jgi:hypothetical protein
MLIELNDKEAVADFRFYTFIGAFGWEGGGGGLKMAKTGSKKILKTNMF